MLKFSDYMTMHKANEGEEITHTRIGDKTKKIAGGSYHIPDADYANTMELYHQAVFVEGRLEYMTEKQRSPIKRVNIDIDLRYDKKITKRQHTPSHIIDMVMLHADKILEIAAIPDNTTIDVFVMHKPDVNIVENKTKDGIHVILDMQMHCSLHLLLRQEVLKCLKNIWDDLPITNSWDDVYDEGVTKGNANWQMYGSRKPGNQAYIVTNHFKITLNDGSWDILELDLASFSIKKNLLALSVRNPAQEFSAKSQEIMDYALEHFPINEKKIVKQKKKLVIVPEEVCPNGELSLLQQEAIELLDIYNHKYFTDYNPWYKTTSGIGNEFSGKFATDTAYKYSKKTLRNSIADNNYDEDAIDKVLEDASKYNFGISTFRYYGKESDPEKANEIINKYKEFRKLEKEKEKEKLNKELKEIREKIKMQKETEKEKEKIKKTKEKETEKEKKIREKNEQVERFLVNKQNERDEYIKQNNIIMIKDDSDAVEYLYKNYEKAIVRTGDGWYVRMRGENWWSYGDEFVKQIITNCNFCMKDAYENIIPYSRNSTGGNKIFSKLNDHSPLAFPKNDNFINEVNLKTRGRVYFEDGYYDLFKKQFCQMDDVIPLEFIKEKMPDFSKLTKEDIAEFEKEVLSIFPSEDQKYVLKTFARAIGGYCCDKKWYVFQGARNSGKGMFQEQNKSAFGSYVTCSDPPIMKSCNTGDSSSMRWIVTTRQHTSRINFTNEAKAVQDKPVELDGEVLKKATASGGDDVLVRRHYGDEFAVKVNTTTFMSFNKLPVCNPKDTLLTMFPIITPYKYVDGDLIDKFYKKSNNELKNKIQTNEIWKNVYRKLVFEAFENKPITYADLPASAKKEYADTMATNMTEPPQILHSHFILDPKGFTPYQDIAEIFKPANLSEKKLKDFLVDRGFELKQKKTKEKDINDKEYVKRVYGYIGLKLKPVEKEVVPEIED